MQVHPGFAEIAAASPESLGSGSEGSHATTPDYATLYNMLSDYEADLPPIEGPYSDALRSSSCASLLLFAIYYLELMPGDNPSDQGAVVLDAFVNAKYCRGAVLAVRARYATSGPEHPSWNVEPYFVARNLGEMAMKDLHDHGDADGVESLRYVLEKLCWFEVEFDSSAEDPLTREEFEMPP